MMEEHDLNRLFERLRADNLFAARNGRNLKFGGRGWLFSGRLKFSPTLYRGRQSWRLDMLIELNLTRFISVRGLPSALGDHRSINEALMRADPSHARTLRTLDRNDNVIPNNLRMAEAQQASWSVEFVSLIGVVLQFIEQRIAFDTSIVDTGEAPAGRPHFVFDRSGWLLKQVEAYWEFYVDDAPAAIERLRYNIPKIAAVLRSTHYEADFPREEPELATERQLHSSQSLSIPLGAEGLQLGIYSKTATRLRFEVRYYGNVRRSLSGHASLAALPNDRYDQIAPLLDLVAERSAERLNRLFHAITSAEATGRPTVRTLVTLLSLLTDACEHDTDLIIRLLSELVSTGRLISGTSTQQDRALTYLLDRNVLQRRSATISGSNSAFHLEASFSDVGGVLRRAFGDRSTSEQSPST